MCAAEVLVWGLKLWWIQERKKGFLEPSVLSRPDCAEGAECARQKDQTHAKECMYFFSFLLMMYRIYNSVESTSQPRLWPSRTYRTRTRTTRASS